MDEIKEMEENEFDGMTNTQMMYTEIDRIYSEVFAEELNIEAVSPIRSGYSLDILKKFASSINGSPLHCFTDELAQQKIFNIRYQHLIKVLKRSKKFAFNHPRSIKHIRNVGLTTADFRKIVCVLDAFIEMNGLNAETSTFIKFFLFNCEKLKHYNIEETELKSKFIDDFKNNIVGVVSLI